MTPDQLIDLAKRKNAAHKAFLQARGAMRRTGTGSERDRDVRMDYDTRDQREEYENLVDEYAIRMVMLEMYGKDA